MVQYRRIGEILLDKGLITQRQLQSALKAQLRTGLRFGEILAATGKVTEDQIAQCLGEQYEYPVVDPTGLEPDPDALKLIDKAFAMSRLILPLRIHEGALACVISDPVDIGAMDTLARMLHLRLRCSVSGPTKLYEAIAKAYGVSVPSSNAPEAEEAPTAGAEAVSPKTRRKMALAVQKDRETLLDELAALVLPSQGATHWLRVAEQ